MKLRPLFLSFFIVLFIVGINSPESIVEATSDDLEVTIQGKSASGGNTSRVAETDIIKWTTTYKNLSEKVLRDVSIAQTLTNNHTVISGSESMPPEWSFDEPSLTWSTLRLCPNDTATCGGVEIEPTGAAVSIGDTGGDGYTPVIHPSNGRIYMTYHHRLYDQGNNAGGKGGIIQCIDPIAGAVCPGYPHTLISGDPNDAFPDETGVARFPETNRFVGDRYFYSVYRADANKEPEWGIGCFDVNSANPTLPGPCDGLNGRANVGVSGFFRLGPQDTSLRVGGSNSFYYIAGGPWELNDRLYFADFMEMQLYCYDPATNATCGAPYPVSLANSDFPVATTINSNKRDPIVAEVVDDRLYIVMDYGYVTSPHVNKIRARCWDTTAGDFCWGNQAPVLASPGKSITMSAFIRLDSSLQPDALCHLSNVNATSPIAGCITLAGQQIPDGPNDTNGVPTALINRINDTTGRGGGKEVLQDGRSYFPASLPEGVVCWDWATNQLCSSFGINGLVTDGTSFNTKDYGLSHDPRNGCFWVLGDSNRLWSFDANSHVPCETVHINLEATVQPHQFFCDSGFDAIASSWGAFQLDEINLSDWSSFDVDIIETVNSQILETFDLKALGQTQVDVISDITLYPTLKFNIRGTVANGADIFSNNRQPAAFLTFDSHKPGELCLQSQPTNGSCSGAALATSGVIGQVGQGTPHSPDSYSLMVVPDGAPILEQVGVAGIAANTRSVSVGSYLYQAKTESVSKTGHLLAIPLDAQGTPQPKLWDAAEILDTPNWNSGREILTYNPTDRKGVKFRWGKLTPEQVARFHLNSAGDHDGHGQDRLQYVRGRTDKEEVSGYDFRARAHRLGTILNSTPFYVGPPSFPDSLDTDYPIFRQSFANRRPMIYVGANDGMVHGFDAATGAEEIAYIPGAIWHQLPDMTDKDWSFPPTVDGLLTALDAKGDFGSERCGGVNTCWRTVLVGGLRRGGQAFYALDVTDPEIFDESLAKQHVLWEFNDADDADLGYTYSQPSIVRMAGGAPGPEKRWAAVVGNGYDNTVPDNHPSTTGRAVLYVLFLDGGLNGEWVEGTDYIKIDTGVGSVQQPNGLSAPAPVDIDADNTVDFVYAGDLYGNLWRFDVRSPVASAWSVSQNPLFTTAGPSQPLTQRPEAGRHPADPDGVLVYVGSGRLLQAEDVTAGAGSTQSVYALADEPDTLNFSMPIQLADLRQQTLLATVVDKRLTSAEPIDWTQHQGWYFSLDTPGERLTTPPILRHDRVIVTSVVPNLSACTVDGTSWLMEFSAISGGRSEQANFDHNGDGEIDEDDLVTVNISGQPPKIAASGIASTEGILASPTILSAGKTERKYSNGSSGNIMVTIESAPPWSRGRQAWRPLP